MSQKPARLSIRAEHRPTAVPQCRPRESRMLVLWAVRATAGEERAMTEHGQLEYKALRATIRERGTARVYVFAGGFAIWSALVVATAALAFPPVATLLPLLVLAA